MTISVTGAVHFAVAGPIAQLTGGYIYDARIVDGLRRLGRHIVVHELAGVHPDADDAARQAARDCVAAIRDGALLVVDGLVLPAFAPVLAQQAARLRLVALIHHPLAAETGLTVAGSERLDRVERDALTHMRRVVVTSPSTADAVAAMGVPSRRIGTVRPGVDAPAAAPGPRGRTGDRIGDACRLLCVATLTPRKGHTLLIEALSDLRRLSWHLDCIGSRDRDPVTTVAIEDAIRAHGLEDRVTLHGERSAAATAAAYSMADVFVLPSYHEGFGMAFAEALAHGLPVVGTTAGAIPGTVPRDAGLLVPPGDPAALREALRAILENTALRNRLARAAASARFPTWSESASQFGAELERAAAR